MAKPVAALLLTLLSPGWLLAQPPGQPPPPPTAQPPAPPAQPPTEATPAPAPKPAPRPPAAWSDPDLAKVGKLLVGTWKTTAPVNELITSGNSEVVLSVAHVGNSELKDVMYAESARLDSLHVPYRHALFQLFKYKGKIRLRTYELYGADFDPAMLTGLWTTPEYFPDIKRSNLIATLDVELEPKGDGFGGKTPYPYPTGVAGAVEMTSEMRLGPDVLTTADRGYDASGAIIWGAADKDKYTFTRFNPPITVTKKDNGLLIVEYKHPSEGRAIENNDRVGVHFTGWLPNGTKWDTSRTRPAPAIFQVGGSPMAGLNEGLLGATKGTLRRLYMPASLAFAEKGYRIIPPHADVILDLEVMSIEPPPTAPAPPAAPPPAAPAGISPGSPPAPPPTAPPPPPPTGPK